MCLLTRDARSYLTEECRLFNRKIKKYLIYLYPGVNITVAFKKGQALNRPNLFSDREVDRRNNY